MRISLLTLCILFTGLSSYAASVNIKLDCETSKQYQAAGYLVGNPKVQLKGAAKTADESAPRKIFEIVNPAEGQSKFFKKAFEFGDFRFVKNNEEPTRGWDVYQRKGPKAAWIQISPTPEKVRIYPDQDLWVKTFGRHQLLVQRISGDDKEAKDFYIYTTKDKITVKGNRKSSREANYFFGHCTNSQPDRPAAPKGEPAKK